MKERLRITIDTREQAPWAFPPGEVEASRGTLKSGDYAVTGDEAGFAVERKSLDDYVGTIGSGWDRFQRELDRMLLFPARVVIVEAPLSDVVAHNYNSPKMLPRFVLARTAELIYCGVTVLFADNREIAAGMATMILRQRERDLPATAGRLGIPTERLDDYLSVSAIDNA